jgi:ketosteroid isomerase-like protein
MFKLILPVALALVAGQALPAGNEDIARHIMSLERAALDRSDRGDAEGFLEISDPSVSYFDPSLAEPIRGLKALTAYYHSLPQYEGGTGEMLNADVQVAGDVAVLTFRYNSKVTRTGHVTHWNSTEVYHRTPAGWRIIHTHWAYTKPNLAK